MQIPLQFLEHDLKSALMEIFSISKDKSNQISASQKAKFSQYFTESNVAKALAEMLSTDHTIIGDHGAGAGILGATAIATFLNKHPQALPRQLRAYEIDDSLHDTFHQCMRVIESLNQAHYPNSFKYSLKGDFLTTSAIKVLERKNTLHAAVLNPPYKKLNQKSPLASFLKQNFCSCPNEYAAFITLTVDMLKENGELVAIVPRSFASGTYFKEFRKWMRKNGSYEWFHRFDSRSNVFRNENVLQENVMFKFRKGVPQSKSVLVSSSPDPDANNTFAMRVDSSHMFGQSTSAPILIPASISELEAIQENRKKPFTFEDMNVSITTGKLEDFRVRSALRHKSEAGYIPIVYAHHISLDQPKLDWHTDLEKPCFAIPTSQILSKCLPRGNYLLIKRISANDSLTRRCQASMLLESSDLKGDHWLIDNHVQVIGASDNLSETQIRKLYKALTSDIAEGVFRATSGTTQLNKEDIKSIRLDSNSL